MRAEGWMFNLISPPTALPPVDFELFSNDMNGTRVVVMQRTNGRLRVAIEHHETGAAIGYESRPVHFVEQGLCWLRVSWQGSEVQLGINEHDLEPAGNGDEP